MIGMGIATALVVTAAGGRIRSVLGDGHDLGRVRVVWLIPAILLAAVSMLAAAMLQRRVLQAAGVRLPLSSMAAITIAGNAVSVTLPLAGSTAGTAFTYHQLKQHGVDLPSAGWALAMSGIVSTSVLAIVLGVGATATGDGMTSILGPLTIVVGVLPMAALVASFRWPAVRAVLERITERTITRVRRLTRRGAGPDARMISGAFARVAGFRLGRRAAAASAALSVINWTADIGCLAACITAFGVPVPWPQIAVVYAAALGAASLSFTPAGVGIVEGALAVALVRAGTPTDIAVVAALMYRAISCWLVLAVGWVTYAVMRSHSAGQPAIGQVTPDPIETRFDDATVAMPMLRRSA
jgi:uncharacterized membrane protein YbhN (UPF0104 family)